ncbi:MAG: rRNA maturation RNase YbeY [Firmicutes bacterium]|nr:rRNA maturation RNase YbeY [Bacillota bacterium]
MLKINIFNQYDDSKEYHKIIKKVIKQAKKDLSIKESKIINVILVTNQEIHDMNLKYRHFDRPTDVLSFDNSDGGKELGDIFISIDKAKEQAIAYGHSLPRELGFLACHGFLHCNGYDHQNPEEEKAMFDLQESILEHASLQR